MLNIVWITMMLISFVYAAISGTMEQTAKAFIESGGAAVEFILSVGGAMALWSGLMNVAEKSGMTNYFSKFLSPVIQLVFSDVKKDSPAEKAIAMNMTANFLGLSNAATPLGIKAMKELKKQSVGDVASDDMCMLSVVNSASIQLIPSTLIAIRSAMGSSDAGSIILPIWIVSIITCLSGIVFSKLSARRSL